MATAPNHPNFPNNRSNRDERHLAELAHLGLQNERSRQDWLDCHQAEIDSLENLIQQLAQAKVEACQRRTRQLSDLDRLKAETRYILRALLNQQIPPDSVYNDRGS